MTVSPRLSLAALAAFLPLAVLAQGMDVPNVTAIRAQVVDGKVTVYWNPVQAPVKNYRIFYSHASILEQGGVYDDYEDAPGTALEHTLSSVPPVSTLYVSVLAVAPDGSESPFFTEEARVELVPSRGTPQNDASPQPLPPSPQAAIDSPVLRLLTATSTSATGVTLAFTHPVSIPEQFRDEAFIIQTGSGTDVPVVRYRLEGNLVLLDTVQQTPGRVYQVQVHPSLAGKTPSGSLVPQEAATAPLLFTGLQADATIPDVQNLMLASKPGTNGYSVEATWTVPQGTIRELQVQQSTNGGRTFGAPTRMDTSSKGVTIPGVPGGTFTLLVRVVGSDGSLSRGVQQTIALSGAAASSSSRAATTVSSARSSVASSKASTPASKPGTLPQSGFGLAAIFALSGAATGMRFVRKKNA